MAKHERTKNTPYNHRAIVIIYRLQDEKATKTNGA